MADWEIENAFAQPGSLFSSDLLVTVEVAVPANLSTAERKALEAFQAASDGASPSEHLGV